MARDSGLRHELVFTDQPQLHQREDERYALHEQTIPRLYLEQSNGLPQVPAREFRVPIHQPRVLDTT